MVWHHQEQKAEVAAKATCVDHFFLFALLSAFFCTGLLFSISCSVQADTIDCNKYRLRELTELCEYASQYPVFVHNDVPSDGLNDLVDTWNENEFHIIPAATYLLSKPVTLNGIILMPGPPETASEPTYTTINLQASPGFQSATDGFYLFSLLEGASAGGIEIQGDTLPDSLPPSPKDSSLVYLPATLDNRFTCNILTGDSRIQMLMRSGSSDNGDAEDIVSIHRNYLRLNGSATGAQVTPGEDGPTTPHLFNNAFIMDSGKSLTTAIKHIGLFRIGGIQLRNNDIVYLDGDNSGVRHGVEILDAVGTLLLNNAFYSASGHRKDSDIGIFAHRQSGRSNRWLVMAGNGMSSGIVPGVSGSGSGDSINLLETGSVQYRLSREYPRKTPGAFFAETGTLGFLPSTVSWLKSTNETVCSAGYQPGNDYPFSDDALPLMSLFQQDGVVCGECQVWYKDPEVMVQIPVAVGIFVISLVTAPLCGCGFGRYAKRL